MKPKTSTLRTPAQVRAAMKAEGVNLREWCRDHHHNYYIVFDLLHGKAKGLRGKSFQAAVSLGLKHPPDTHDFTPQKPI